MKPTTRKVVHRAPWRKARLINLPTLQSKAIEADSTYERDFVYRAALFPYVKTIQSQPFRLTFEGKAYTPDFLLSFQDDSQSVIEVKPERFQQEFSDLFQQARQKLEESGIRFLVVGESVLFKVDIDKRAQVIRRYAKLVPDPREAQIADDIIRAHGNASVQQLTSAGVSLGTILSLVSAHQLELETDLQFQPASLVSLPQPTSGASYAVQFDEWLNA